MNRKLNIVDAVALLALLISGTIAVGYVSNPAVSSKPDVEWSGGLSGDTVEIGQCVSIDYSYNSYMTGVYDTGSWVIRSSAENDSFVVGIATQSCVPGQTIKWVSHGPVEAKVDGSDSVPTQTAISTGVWLSAADRDGFLGCATSDSNTTVAVMGRNVSECNPVAYFIDGACAVTDSGAITTYKVFVTIR